MTKLNRELILSLAVKAASSTFTVMSMGNGVQQYSGGSFGSGGLDMSDLQDESPSLRRRRRMSKKITTYDFLRPP